MKRLIIISFCILTLTLIAKEPSVGISLGYPGPLIGFHIAKYNTENIGVKASIYGSILTGIDTDDTYDNISIHQAEDIFGDDFVKCKSEYYSGSISFLYRIKTTAWEVGLSYTELIKMNQYYDEYEILGSNGKYWIEAKKDNYVSPLLGVHLNGKKCITFVNFHSVPFLLNIGVLYKF